MVYVKVNHFIQCLVQLQPESCDINHTTQFDLDISAFVLLLFLKLYIKTSKSILPPNAKSLFRIMSEEDWDIVETYLK